MKVCKNCGQQTDDDRVRCPACGHVFEADIDAVLSRMKSDLNDCKAVYMAPAAPRPEPAQPAAPQEAAQQPAAQQEAAQQPAMPQAAQQPARQTAGSKEQYDMMATLAEMSGEIRALHNEIGRMQAMNAQGPYFRSGGGQYYGTPRQGKLVKVRSTNRIVLSAINIILIAVSVALFFGTWVNFTVAENAYSFKGFDAVRYLLTRTDADGAAELADTIAATGVGREAFLEYLLDAEGMPCVKRNILYELLKSGERDVPLYSFGYRTASPSEGALSLAESESVRRAYLYAYSTATVYCNGSIPDAMFRSVAPLLPKFVRRREFVRSCAAALIIAGGCRPQCVGLDKDVIMAGSNEKTMNSILDAFAEASRRGSNE